MVCYLLTNTWKHLKYVKTWFFCYSNYSIVTYTWVYARLYAFAFCVRVNVWIHCVSGWLCSTLGTIKWHCFAELGGWGGGVYSTVCVCPGTWTPVGKAKVRCDAVKVDLLPHIHHIYVLLYLQCVHCACSCWFFWSHVQSCCPVIFLSWYWTGGVSQGGMCSAEVKSYSPKRLKQHDSTLKLYVCTCAVCEPGLRVCRCFIRREACDGLTCHWVWRLTTVCVCFLSVVALARAGESINL